VNSVLHVAHFDPPIHGEAMMASQLRQVAKTWNEITYLPLNTVFSTERDDLGKASPRKALLLVCFLTKMLAAKIRWRSQTLLFHPAFHPGPFLKGSSFIWLAWLLRMRIVGWVHMDPNRLDWNQRPAWFKKWAALTLRRVDLFVACADSLPSTWPEWLRDHPHTAIFNAIQDPLHGKPPPHRDRAAGQPLRVIYLSALDPEKGWRDLFQAAVRICSGRNDVEFHFHGGIGVGEKEDEVRKTFDSSPYPERIKWLGPVWDEEKIKALCEADLFVFPSHTEQLPLAILEAMACGLPVIATGVGAVRDAVLTDTGYLVEPGSPESLEVQIDHLLRSRNLLEQMGKNARRVYLERFTLGPFSLHWQQNLSVR
jgi:glycosyltransferase involved in cell wall biosynthesis